MQRGTDSAEMFLFSGSGATNMLQANIRTESASRWFISCHVVGLTRPDGCGVSMPGRSRATHAAASRSSSKHGPVPSGAAGRSVRQAVCSRCQPGRSKTQTEPSYGPGLPAPTNIRSVAKRIKRICSHFINLSGGLKKSFYY